MRDHERTGSDRVLLAGVALVISLTMNRFLLGAHVMGTVFPPRVDCMGQIRVANAQGRRRMAIALNRNLGFMLLGVWLILNGLIGIFSLAFAGLGVILSVLALAAGVLILVGK